MAMTDEEILSAAGRLRAARRRRVAKTCEVCGTPFEGVAQRRYCSDRCRVKAARERQSDGANLAASGKPILLSRHDGESVEDYIARVTAHAKRPSGGTEEMLPVIENASPSAEHVRRERVRRTMEVVKAGDAATIEQLMEVGRRMEGETVVEHVTRIRDAVMQGRTFTDDSTEILRQARIDRSKHLADL